MQAEYSGGTITLRLIGEYALSEMRDAFRGALPSKPGEVRGLIIDISRSVSVGARSDEEVRGMAQWWAASRRSFQGRIAMIAQVDTEADRKARMSAVEVAAVGLDVEVFVDEDDARTWIDGGHK